MVLCLSRCFKFSDPSVFYNIHAVGNEVNILIFLSSVKLTLCKICVIYNFILCLFYWNIRANKASDNTIPKMRQSKEVIRLYRIFQVLLVGLNDIAREYVLVLVNNIAMTMSVLCNYGLIRFHDTVPLETLVQMTIISVASTVYLITTCINLGNVNEISKSTVNSWKRKYSKVKCCEEDKLMLMYFNSCRFLRVELGSYGYYKKATTLGTIGKIFVYTAKFTLTMNKIFRVKVDNHGDL